MAYADSIRSASATMDAVASLLEGVFVSGYPLTFSTWTPTLSAGGSMTYTSTTIRQANYIQVGKLVLFEIDVTGTVGGTPHSDLKFTLPVTAAASTGGGGGGNLTDGGVGRVGYWYPSSTTIVTVNKDSGGNWTAGTAGYRFFGGYRAA